MEPFHRIYTDDRIINQIQENVARAVNPLLSLPPNNGLLLQEVTLKSGDNLINHLLGRDLIGWVLTRKQGNADIYDKQSSNPLPNKTLALNSSADVVIDLWVF